MPENASQSEAQTIGTNLTFLQHTLNFFYSKIPIFSSRESQDLDGKQLASYSLLLKHVAHNTMKTPIGISNNV